MKRTPRVLIVLFLGVSFALQIACATAPPVNSNQPGANANVSPPSPSQAKPSPKPDQRATGTIEVTSKPTGARVLLISTDGEAAGEPQAKGVTPTTITEVRPGKYTVDLEKPGYRFFQKEIVVKKGGSTKVTATLKKQ